MPKDSYFYDLLGIEPGATAEEIKRAYKRRAKELHPDKTGGDPDKENLFKQVKNAYETLIDPVRRAQYDETGSGPATPIEIEATGILSSLFAGMIDQIATESITRLPHSAGKTVQEMVDGAKKNIDENHKGILNCAKVIEKLEEIRPKVEFDGKGKNLFTAVLDQKIELIKDQRKGKEHNIQVNEEILKMLKHYKDVMEEEEKVGRISLDHHYFPTRGPTC